jgi:hypothetical protein
MGGYGRAGDYKVGRGEEKGGKRMGRGHDLLSLPPM